MGFDVLFGGVGNAFSTRHFGTHLLLDHPDSLFAIDCPDGFRRALDEHRFSRDQTAGADDTPPDHDSDRDHIGVGDLDGLFITHLHGDHVNGLEMSLAFRRYVIGKPIDLYGPPTLEHTLWERRLGSGLGQSYDGERYRSLGPDDFYNLEIVPWREGTEIGPWSIETYKTTHHLPAAAMRIEADGVSLGYSCDTVYDRDLIDWLGGTDLILHETGVGPGHTPLDKLTELPERITDRMMLVHYPDALIGADPPIQLAEEGKRVCLQ